MPSKSTSQNLPAVLAAASPRKRKHDSALKVPLVGGSLLRIVRDKNASPNRPDLIENRWDAIKDDAHKIPGDWGVGVVAYPVYRTAQSIQRFRSKAPSRGPRPATPSDKTSYSTWLEFAHAIDGTDLIERYKLSRVSGLMVQRRFNREGRRRPAVAGAVRPHPYRRATSEEIDAIPQAVRGLMEKVATLIGVSLAGGKLPREPNPPSELRTTR